MSLQEELESIVREFHADSGTIHLIKADHQLHLAAAYQIPEVVLDRVRVVPIGKGMAGLAAERRLPVTVCNIQSDLSGDVRPGAKLTGMEGAIALPMLDDTGKVGGVLGIANRAERTFTAEEENALMKKGRQLLLCPR
jgi:signal transduction protein with GAF and PtsI domain